MVESLVRTIRAYFSVNQKQFDQSRLATILSVDLIGCTVQQAGIGLHHVEKNFDWR